MAVYFIVSIIIEEKHDRKPYDDYIQKVKPVVERYGGKYLARSEKISLFAGTWTPDRMIIIEFDSKEQLNCCFSSPEYTRIKGLRENSVITNAVIVEQ